MRIKKIKRYHRLLSEEGNWCDGTKQKHRCPHYKGLRGVLGKVTAMEEGRNTPHDKEAELMDLVD